MVRVVASYSHNNTAVNSSIYSDDSLVACL